MRLVKVLWTPSNSRVSVTLLGFQICVNKQPDKKSPWNAPKKLWNSADKEPFTLTLSSVSDSLTKRISISSSSQPHSTRRSRMVERRKVSMRKCKMHNAQIHSDTHFEKCCGRLFPVLWLQQSNSWSVRFKRANFYYALFAIMSVRSFFCLWHTGQDKIKYCESVCDNQVCDNVCLILTKIIPGCQSCYGPVKNNSRRNKWR